MEFKLCSSAVFLALVTLCCSTPASAQLLGGTSGAGGASGAAGTALDVDRVRSRINQRVQAQVQSRVQAQLQTRVQGQVKARIQSQAQRAANVAKQISVAAQQRAAAARNDAQGGISIGANAGVSSRAGGNVAGNSVGANSRTRVATNADVGIPNLTAADVQAYESIFGEFSPLGRPAQPQQPPSSDGVQPEPAPPAADSSVADDPSENPETPSRPGLLSLVAEGDFAGRIAVAARHRRAQISALRDKALATGNIQLMDQADVMEARLNAFVDAQARLHVQAQQSAAQTQQSAGQTQQSATAQTSTDSNVSQTSATETGAPAAPAAPAADAQLGAAANGSTTIQ